MPFLRSGTLSSHTGVTQRYLKAELLADAPIPSQNSLMPEFLWATRLEKSQSAERSFVLTLGSYGVGLGFAVGVGGCMIGTTDAAATRH